MWLVYFNLGVTHLLVLHDDVEQFLGEAVQNDDMCLVTFSRSG